MWLGLLADIRGRDHGARPQGVHARSASRHATQTSGAFTSGALAAQSGFPSAAPCTVCTVMDHCPFQPLESPRRASRVAATPGVLEEAPTRKEGQPCSLAAVLCSAEARLRNQKLTAVRRDPLSSRPTRGLEASRPQPRSLAGDARQIELGRTHLSALCDAHPPTQAPNPALRRLHAARDASQPCDGPAGPSATSAAAVSYQQKGIPFVSTRRSKDQERPPRQGAPHSAALLANPRSLVSRHARRLHGGAHPVTDPHAGATDGARVRVVRARSHPAGSARPETATATEPQARVSRA
jgi:hypothetical protein